MLKCSWPGRGLAIGSWFSIGVAVHFVVVLPAAGVPQFGRPAEYHVDGAPVGVGIFELDGENGRDIATANSTGVDGPSFSLLANRGNESFETETRGIAGEFSVQTAVTADFDDDGLGDIALAVDDIAIPVRGLVLIYLNRGDGQFAEPVEYALPGFFIRCLEVGDVDGDEVLDLVACHSRDSVGGSFEGRVSVLLGEQQEGSPSGTFRVAFSEVFASEPASADVGMLDADDRADIVVGDPVDGVVGVLYGVDQGFSRAAPVADVESVSAVAIVPQSGAAEIVATSRTRGRLIVLEQTQDRVFASLEEHQVFLPSALRVADFDDDGIFDVTVASSLGAELWLGRTAGRFERGELIFVASFGQLSTIDLATGDFNQDGMIDIAASSSEDDLVTIALNGADAPSGTFPPGDANCDGSVDEADLDGVIRRIFSPGCPAADVNGDGVVTAADLTALSETLAS